MFVGDEVRRDGGEQRLWRKLHHKYSPHGVAVWIDRINQIRVRQTGRYMLLSPMEYQRAGVRAT